MEAKFARLLSEFDGDPQVGKRVARNRAEYLELDEVDVVVPQRSVMSPEEMEAEFEQLLEKEGGGPLQSRKEPSLGRPPQRSLGSDALKSGRQGEGRVGAGGRLSSAPPGQGAKVNIVARKPSGASSGISSRGKAEATSGRETSQKKVSLKIRAPGEGTDYKFFGSSREKRLQKAPKKVQPKIARVGRPAWPTPVPVPDQSDAIDVIGDLANLPDGTLDDSLLLNVDDKEVSDNEVVPNQESNGAKIRPAKAVDEVQRLVAELSDWSEEVQDVVKMLETRHRRKQEQQKELSSTKFAELLAQEDARGQVFTPKSEAESRPKPTSSRTKSAAVLPPRMAPPVRPALPPKSEEVIMSTGLLLRKLRENVPSELPLKPAVDKVEPPRAPYGRITEEASAAADMAPRDSESEPRGTEDKSGELPATVSTGPAKPGSPVTPILGSSPREEASEGMAPGSRSSGAGGRLGVASPPPLMGKIWRASVEGGLGKPATWQAGEGNGSADEVTPAARFAQSLQLRKWSSVGKKEWEQQEEEWVRAQALHQSQEPVVATIVTSNQGGVLARVGCLLGFIPCSELGARHRPPSLIAWGESQGFDMAWAAAKASPGSVSDAPSALPTQSTGAPENPEAAQSKEILQLYKRARFGLLASIVGRTVEVKIVNLDSVRRHMVLSERVAEGEADLAESKKDKVIAELEVGQVVRCQVTHVNQHYAFVNLMGVDAIIHVSEMSWGRLSHPADILSVGQTVEAKVCRLDHRLRRIALSLKQMQPDPLLETLDSLVDGGAFTPAGNSPDFGPPGMPDLDGPLERLRDVDGVSEVFLGRRFRGQALAPAFQLYLSAQLPNGFKLLARSGAEVQEVLVRTTLDRERMKAAVKQAMVADT